jgi:type III secretion system YscJ/HrcJ family lipoprotein
VKKTTVTISAISIPSTRGQRRLAPVLALLMTAACGVETVVHNLEEREANQIIELLAEDGISASKGMLDTGRSVSYQISVPSGSRLSAIKALNRNEMPRRRDMGYTDVFKDSGLIPTAAEERAKQLAAIEGEIEKQLKLVDGILDVQVNLVIPEETALRTAQDVRSPTTASVTIKYLPGSGGTKPLSEPQVQAVVAAGVERLTPDNVVVVMTPAGPIGGRPTTAPDSGGLHFPAVGGMSQRTTQMLIIGMVAVVMLLALVLAVSQIRLRTVRGRLVRLQSEIAKARRKPDASAPPPP